MPFDPSQYVSPRAAKMLRVGAFQMTQRGWAFVLQVHPITVSKWERGESAIPDRCQPWLQAAARSGGASIRVRELADMEARRHYPAPAVLVEFWKQVLDRAGAGSRQSSLF